MRWYPSILKRVLLPLAEKVLGTPYISILKEWKQLESLQAEEIHLRQQKKLKKILAHAVRTVPGYQELSEEAELTDFPIATKAMYRQDEDRWISDLFNKQGLLVEKSSGSSGIQGKVFMTKAESMRAIAHQTYLWSWAGYEPGNKLLQLGMTLDRTWMKSLKDRLFRTTYTQAFDLNSEEVRSRLTKFRGNQQGVFFGGYASGLYEYARIASQNNISDVHFDAVISWGDKMFPHYRKLIESQFHGRVYDIYGTTEGFVIAGQCEKGAYHILSPHVYLELLDDAGQEVKAGELGHVVITRLDSFSMPLIRYRLGDLAIKEKEELNCACGRPYPMLQKIIGRDTDVIRSPSGKALIVHFFTGIFEHIPEIIQFQVVQEKPESFVLRFISDRGEDAIKPILSDALEKMNTKAGENLNVTFERVEQIFPSPSGKPQIIISKLTSNEF